MTTVTNTVPRWRGFNLLDMYVYESGRELMGVGDTAGPGGYGGGEGDFAESDFQFTADHGFDFLRLPLDYRYWTNADFTFREQPLARLDRALELAGRYGLHLSLSLHRAPGYCVNPPGEARSLWTDPETQQRFVEQWEMLARRYCGVPAERLSFDLLNEPPALGLAAFFSRNRGSGASRGSHEAVMRRAVAAIAAIDPGRQIMLNGLNFGNDPLPELKDLAPRVGQSCRAYLPFGVTHYKAHWVNYPWLRKPRWPGGDHFGRTLHLEDLEAHYARWTALLAQGVGVHCGEGGVFSKTPHGVALAWMRDMLGVLKRVGIGWALWNLRGDFGPLNSNRSDVAYEAYRGQLLDRAMLEVLRES